MRNRIKTATPAVQTFVQDKADEVEIPQETAQPTELQPSGPQEPEPQGDENDDDAQPSQPVGHAAPEQNTERQAFYIFYDRSPCTGKAGNAFKHTVNQIQVPASHIGNHPQEGG